MFGLKSILGLAGRLVPSAWRMASKGAEDALSATNKKIYNNLRNEFVRDHGEDAFTDLAKEKLISRAEELGELSKASWLKRGLAAVGIGAGGLATVGVVDSAVSGEDSVAHHAIQNIMTMGKTADATSDMKGLWEKIISFFTEGYKAIAEALGWDVPNSGGSNVENNSGGQSGPDISDQSGATQEVGFLRGMFNDAADLDNWTVSNAVNLAHAAGHGVVDGVGLIGSFAYANTVGWFTGQSTDEVHNQYVGAAIDSAFEKTIGMPDLSGHWAQAVNNVSSFAAPGGAAVKLGRGLISAFKLTDAAGKGATAARISIHAGTQVAAPSV